MHIHTAVKSTVAVGATALELANNVGGVPFAGTAVVLLGELGRTCEEVKIRKSDCRRLIFRAQAILDGLQDPGPSGLVGTRLQEAGDELEMILQQINSRMNKWSRCHFVRAWWKREDIAKSIAKAEQELEAHVDKFQIRAHCANYEKLQEIDHNHQRSHEETRELLYQIIASQQGLQELYTMRQAGERADEDVMGAAQTELHEHSRNSARYLDYEQKVLNLHNFTGVMPTLPDLSYEVVKTEGPVAGGTYSDVWLGKWLGGLQVALKSLREVKVSPNVQKRFEHEITVWHNLKHPHVLRFLGVVSNLGPHIHIVSPWQPNGNALEYVKSRPWVDRLKLLTGAARGVEYLHGREKPVVHGNLKCANILISDEASKGEAVISDFGLSRVVEDITETIASATLTTSGSSRWCAPEVMAGTSSPNLATDVYSFSMAILECLTLEKPFPRVKRDTAVVVEVYERKGRPLRPGDEIWDRWFSEELWKLMERCWSHDPSSRPQMTEVAAQLQSLGQAIAHRHLASLMDL